MAFVIDFQAFKSVDDEFIVKELAIVKIDGDSEFNMVFKPHQPYSTLPRSMQDRVDYVSRRIHGIRWDSGSVDYYDVIGSIKDSLMNEARIIFVKGLERSKYIRNFLEDTVKVENLDDYMAGYKGYGGDACTFHTWNCGRCSLSKAKDFKMWLLNHGYHSS